MEDLRGELLAENRRLLNGIGEENTELDRLRTAPTELCGHHPKQRRLSFAFAAFAVVVTGARRVRGI